MGAVQCSGNDITAPCLEKRNENGYFSDRLQASRRSFAMRETGGNRLVPGSYYMVDALKLPNHAFRGSDESLQKCVAWCCPNGTQHLFCWPILAISG
ncbi:hypothetical protein TNCV_614601 [Trichonephila clavipes]|nr:hypothetical protein TNCV_614601 [Trichonephila clavipes]